ncbi:MAG: Fic family protein [Rehaibacterium terrae]|uniref:Fic family protein n=1 Tax=Rehaibacterium terrae TaxID=1341696 RepID=UPI00391BA016
MKALPKTPSISSLWGLREDRRAAVFETSLTLDDGEYRHWEELRHRQPPAGLSVEEWWLALKLKRSYGALAFPTLTASNGRPLTVFRHARIDAGMARMDRLLGGQLALPETVRNEATRDQYLASSLMEEAIHSSLFEGAASTREVAKDMLRSARPPINRDERMILNNYRAMERIRELRQEPLSLELLLELHRILTDGTLDKPECAGRFQRPGEARIRVIDDRTNRVLHEPPPAEQLPERLDRLIAFANADDIHDGQFVHPVLRSILLHFQLAYDHPFYDGNGRTARALFYWSMLRRGYWLAEFLSISRLLYVDRGPYLRAYLYTESDEQDATYFVLQQIGVLESAVDELFEYVRRKSEAQRQVRQLLSHRGDLNHRQLALLDHALRKPDAEYTHESHASSHRISIVTARSDLLRLVEFGWLRQLRRGKRFVYMPTRNLEARLRPR